MIIYKFVCFNCTPNGLVLKDYEVDVLPGELVTTEYWGATGHTQYGASTLCGACRDDVESHAMCDCGNGIPLEGYDECSRCMEVASA